MTELKLITKTSHYVDAYDLCKFLTEKIGRRVEFGDTGNDTDYTASPDGDIDDYDQEPLNEFLKSGYMNFDYPGIGLYLNYAVKQGWIKPGDYVIRVSW